MPDFSPNEYLISTHADKGKEEWEIYAWAVRDAMCKASGYIPCDTPLRKKVLYEDFVCGRKDYFCADNKHIRAP